MAGPKMRYDTHAVSARRIDPQDSRDDFPTPDPQGFSGEPDLPPI